MTLFSDLEKLQTPASCFKNAYKKITHADKFSYITGFLTCLLVNMFVYTNTCFVHDSIRIYDDSTGIANGRMLIGPLLEVINRIQIPWIIGLITCFLMGFVIVFLAKIFKLQSKISIIFCAGFVVTSEAMVVSHAYFNSVYIYVFSLLLAVLAVFVADKRKYGFFLSVFLLVLSMMCYQAYITTAIGLFIFKMLLNIIENKSTIKKQLLLTVKYASISVLSALVYYVVWQLILKLLNTEIVEYYAYKNLGTVPTLKDFIDRFFYAWDFSLQLLQKNDLINSFPLVMICGVTVNLIVLISLLVYGIKKRRLVFTAVYILTYIASINLMYILSGTVLHSLTIFSLVFVFLTLLYFFDNKFKLLKKGALISWISFVLSVVLIFSQAIFANSLYLKLKINYDNAWSYSTRLIDRLEQTEGFNKNSKLILIGEVQRITNYKQNPKILKRIKYDTRIQIVQDVICGSNAISYASTLKWFIQQEMDMYIDIEVNPEDLIKEKAIREMPVFPDADSIQVIDGAYVVKVSNLF